MNSLHQLQGELSSRNSSRLKHSKSTCSDFLITNNSSSDTFRTRAVKFTRKNQNSHYGYTNKNESLNVVMSQRKLSSFGQKLNTKNPELKSISQRGIQRIKTSSSEENVEIQGYIQKNKRWQDAGTIQIKYVPMADVLYYKGSITKNKKLIERRLFNKIKMGLCYY